MKPLFLKKKSMWLSVLLAGVFLVAVGLLQLSASFDAVKGGRGGGPLSPVAESSKARADIRKSSPVESDLKRPASVKKGANVGEGKPNDYFVEYRLERDRIRSQQVDWFREIVNNQSSADETRREAQKRMLSITQAVDTEMKIENLIKAENFKDAVVIINDKSATVIVQVPMLTPTDKKKITEITARITGFSPETVEIIAKV